MEPGKEVRRAADHSVRAAHDGDASRIEHLLMSIPVLLSITIGLAFGVTRCILVVKDNLQGPASSLSAVAFLIAVFAAVVVLIVLASAAIGFLIGLVLQAGYGSWRSHKIERPALS
ncbi:MAG TPA: hypothetical protein VMT86_03775 [Bryobacteraceae bacterium]|nr:hypothetical protein [Bryobacteraceae bacterium]